MKEASGHDAKEIEDELSDIKTVWCQLNTLLQDRREKIERVNPLAIKYKETLQTLARVMSTTYTTLDSLHVIGAQPEKVTEQIERIKVIFVIFINYTSCLLIF